MSDFDGEHLNGVPLDAYVTELENMCNYLPDNTFVWRHTLLGMDTTLVLAYCIQSSNLKMVTAAKCLQLIWKVYRPHIRFTLRIKQHDEPWSHDVEDLLHEIAIASGDYWLPWYLLGRIMPFGNYQFKKAIECNQQNINAMLCLVDLPPLKKDDDIDPSIRYWVAELGYVGCEDIIKRAISIEPSNPYCYTVYCDWLNYSQGGVNPAVCLADGRIMDKVDLCAEAIRLDPECAVAWVLLYLMLMDNAPLPFPTTLAKDVAAIGIHAIGISTETSAYLYGTRKIQRDMVAKMQPSTAWSRLTHRALWQCIGPVCGGHCKYARTTPALFSVLLLGLQRLEADAVIQNAHHSMIEDMLECWTWIDHKSRM